MNKIAILAALLLASCNNTPFVKKTGTKAKSDSGNVVAAKVKPELEKEQIAGTNFRVKDSVQLRSSLEACFGPNLTVVKDTMIRQVGLPINVAPDRLRFLTGYAVNDDVIAKLASDLYEPSAVTRTATNADALTQSYMSALSVVGDVVAHSCEISSAANCDCRTPEAASALIQRCVPHLSPEKEQKASEFLAASCKGGGLKQRQALASFIASSLFAEKK